MRAQEPPGTPCAAPTSIAAEANRNTRRHASTKVELARGGRAGAQGLDAIRQATLNMLADNLD